MAGGFELHSPGSMEPSALHSSPSTKSSVFGIMQMAIDFPLKNKKLMIQVFMICFTPILILVLLHSAVAKPFIAKVEDGYENNSVTKQDLIHLLLIEIPFVLTLWVVMIFASAATSLGTVYIHEGLSLSLKERLLRLKLRWTFLFTVGLCSSLSLAVFTGATTFFTRLVPVTGFIAVITYPYLVSIHWLVLVICTLENEHRGEKAFRQAVKVAGQGTFQGYFLMLVLTLITAPGYILWYVTATDDEDENALITQFFFLSIVSLLLSVTSLYTNLVYALLYLDFKKRQSEEIRDLAIQYEVLPTCNTDG